MSCELSPDSFHVKKGGRRKTVSKRRAYIDTPSDITRKEEILLEAVDRSLKYAKGGGISRPTIAGIILRLENIRTTILRIRPTSLVSVRTI